jgi:hypothetical protein
VRPVFEAYVSRFELADRLQFYPGDFFTDELPSADVLVMGHILHDWDLTQKCTLLDKAYAALPTGGALVVYEALIDDDRRTNTFGLLMSLNMLIETPEASTIPALIVAAGCGRQVLPKPMYSTSSARTPWWSASSDTGTLAARPHAPAIPDVPRYQQCECHQLENCGQPHHDVDWQYIDQGNSHCRFNQ